MEKELYKQDGIVIDEQSKYYMLKAAKWSKIIAIAGMIVAILVAIMAFFTGSMFTLFSDLGADSGVASFIGGTVFVIYNLIGALLIFIPSLFLYRFSTRTKQAIHAMYQVGYNSGMQALSRFFQFLGIIFLIYILLGILFFLGVMLFGIIGVAGSTMY